MKLVCAWCVNEARSGEMGEKPPYDDMSATHGICPDCLAKWRDLTEFWRERSLDLTNRSARPDLSGVSVTGGRGNASLRTTNAAPARIGSKPSRASRRLHSRGARTAGRRWTAEAANKD